MKIERALVTGGCGFVGRRLTKRLLSLGAHVTMVDDLSTGQHLEKWLRQSAKVNFFEHDLREWILAGPHANYDAIFHCAAVVGGRLKIDGDPLAVAVDLAIDATFFNWLAQEKPRPRKVVYFSSSAVYPVELQTERNHCALSEALINFDSTRIGRPDMTYGWSKLSGEYLARIAAQQYDLDVVIYRPFSGYGEDQDLSYPFPSIVKRVYDGEDPITIWGSGRQVRDFIYIEDVVDAVLATMDKLPPGEALNLGSGIGTTFRTISHMARDYLGKNVQVVNDISKPEGVNWRVADTTKLNQWYRPTTSLNDGIIKALEHLDRNRKAL